MSYVLPMLARCRTELDRTAAMLHQLPSGSVSLIEHLTLNAQNLL